MNDLCPYLPKLCVEKALRHGKGRGAEFYVDALHFAQSYWMEGKPAQAILQLNKAFSADLSEDDAVLGEWPWPYEALRWILEKSVDGKAGFLGNPVRHFQHLATRMNEVRRERRIDHAWRCYHIAREVLMDRAEFPRDGRQMAREGIFIPAKSWKG